MAWKNESKLVLVNININILKKRIWKWAGIFKELKLTCTRLKQLVYSVSTEKNGNKIWN